MNTENKFNLPLHSRVWIYQSSRKFTATEIDDLASMTDNFLTDWNTHGKALSAEISLIHNLFFVITVDEEKAMASGCSIDKSVRLVKDIEKKFNVSLTGRTNVAYLDEEKNIHFKNFADLKKEIVNGQIKDSVLIFNNLISSLADMQKAWVIPAKESWLMDVKV
jgi:hypothetical protein